MTKQRKGKWPYIANAVSELFKILVKKVTFGALGVTIAPIAPLYPPLVKIMWCHIPADISSAIRNATFMNNLEHGFIKDISQS